MTKCKCLVCDCNTIHSENVADAKSKMLDDELLFDISDFYKALADSTRIKIVNALDKNELCVCDISALLNMTKSAVSHQLRCLREMNLVKCRRQGKEALYSLADEHVREVFEVSLQHILELKQAPKTCEKQKKISPELAQKAQIEKSRTLAQKTLTAQEKVFAHEKVATKEKRLAQKSLQEKQVARLKQAQKTQNTRKTNGGRK